MYFIEKTINKLYSDGYTYFLNPKELKDITNHLKKNTYNIYKPYELSEKNIIYLKDIPSLILFEIIISVNIKHQDILGALYSLGIEDNLFGDIIIHDNHYYFYTFQNLKTYFEMEFTKIGKNNISLITQDINYLNDYEPSFLPITIINSSLRIDSVIAKIIHTNREKVKELMKEKKIIYNYDLLKDNSTILKTGDTFSIRRFGKYKFNKIISNTKKDNLVIEILKYINNEKN